MKRAKTYFGVAFFAIISLNMLTACQSPSATPIDTEPFIQLAENASCAEIRNQLYLIDSQYVFWSSQGHCDDAGYAHVLYGRTPQEKLCYLEDSFVGPISSCDSALSKMFETILANLDQPDLGLGDQHSVNKVFENQN